LNCHDHDCFSQVHDLTAFNFNETCENKQLVNQSQLSCTFSVNNDIGLLLDTNNSLHALELIKISFGSSLLSSSFSKFHQTISDSHVNFYNPINIWLENWLKESYLVNTVLYFVLLGISVHNRFNFSFSKLVTFLFLLQMFDVYICAGLKMFDWLHWKYNFT
jgi:hypothetical protein